MEELCTAISLAHPGCPRPLLCSVALELLQREVGGHEGDINSACKKLARTKWKLLRRYSEEVLEKMTADFLEGEELRGRLPDSALGRSGPTTNGHVSQENAVLAALSYFICMRLVQSGTLLEISGAGDGNSKQRQEDDVSGGIARKFLLPSPMGTGIPTVLLGWAAEYRVSKEHQKRLLKAIKRGEQGLCEDKHGVALGPDLDFGIKRSGSASNEGVATYFRSSWVANHGTAPVMLVDITAAPAMHGVITVHDDLGLAVHRSANTGGEPSSGKVASEAPVGMIMKQGAVYSVVCELRCTVEDGAVLQQWLLFTFLRNGAWERDGASSQEELFVIARRVSAVLLKNDKDMHHCLSTEAKPFYPAYLRHLFDSAPSRFVAADPPAMLPLLVKDRHPPGSASLQNGIVSAWPESTFRPAMFPRGSYLRSLADNGIQPLLAASSPEPPGTTMRIRPPPLSFAPPLFSPPPPSPNMHNPRSPFMGTPPHDRHPPPHRPLPIPMPPPHLELGGAYLLNAPPVNAPQNGQHYHAQQTLGVYSPYGTPVPMETRPPLWAPPWYGPYTNPLPQPLPHVHYAQPRPHPPPPFTAQITARQYFIPNASFPHAGGAGGPPPILVSVGNGPIQAQPPNKNSPINGGGNGPGGSADSAVMNGHAPLRATDGLNGHFAGAGPSTALDAHKDDDVAVSMADLASAHWCPCVRRQLRQLARLLVIEELTMERDIKTYDIFNAKLSWHKPRSGPDQLQMLFRLEVPGLPENRPSVMVGDIVYLRSNVQSSFECAAAVHAVELRPSPALILSVSKMGKLSSPEAVANADFHVRFTFDRQPLARMHAALASAAASSMQLLPCMCLARSRLVEPSPSILPDELDLGTSIAPLKAMPSPPGSRMMSEADCALPLPCRPPLKVDELELFNVTLNPEQQHAVRNFLEAKHGPGPYLLFGPPGTGKTVTVVECVLQVLKWIPTARLCVCAPSNYAADILCSGIAAGGVSQKEMWRLNDPRRTMASVKSDVVRFCSYDNELGMFNVRQDAHEFRIIVCTCGAAALLWDRTLWPPERSPSNPLGIFSHILIDEAGQALIAETLIPLTMGGTESALLLCGDPKQLGPIVHSSLASLHGLSQSLLERFMLSAAYEAELRRHGSSPIVVKLLRNYRSNSDLLVVPSALFYGGELIASAEENAVAPPTEWEEMRSSNFPILFFGVKGKQMREGEAPSYFNPVEASILVDLLVGLLARTSLTAQDIGVMAPYRRQVQKLRLLLRERGLSAVRVGNIDDYQGQEEKVIFISTVLSRPESLGKGAARASLDKNLGFLGNAKRFNVAITRAKALLVVVGHPLVLLEDENWREVLKFCKAKDAYRGAGAELVPAWGKEEARVPNSMAALGNGGVHGAKHAARGGKAPSAEEGGDDEGMEGEGIPNGVDDYEEENVMASGEMMEETFSRLAEMYLLGGGDADKIYPSDYEALYSDNMDGEPEFRVML